jgi:hypothetical protein
MARYVIFANAFMPDGYLHEASLEKPKVVDLPDDYAPSLTWVPMNQAAVDALELLVEEKRDNYVASEPAEHKAHATKMAKKLFRAKPMPPGADKMPLVSSQIAPISVKKAKTKDAVEQDAIANLAAGGKPVATLPQAFSMRPSDTEPE